MKLQNLTLENFINHQKLAINFNHVNIISGANGSGKSALLQAIIFALTGASRRPVVNWQGSSATANLRIQGLEISRKETKSGSKDLKVIINGVTTDGSPTVTQEALLKALNLTTDQIETVLETGRFLSLSDAQRKDVFYRSFNIRITPENLERWLSDQDPATDWKKIVAQEIESGIDIEDDNQKTYVERRRLRKRQASDLETELQRLTPPDVDVTKEQTAKDLLDKYRGELAKLYEQKGQASQLQSIQIEFEAVKSELNKPDNSDRIRRLSDDVTEFEGELSDLRNIREDLLSKRAEERGILSGIGDFNELGESCPTCQQKITKTLAKKLQSEHNKRVKMHEVKLKDIESDLAKIQKDFDALSEKIAATKSEIKSLESGNYKGDRKSLEKRYDQLLKQINDLKNVESVDKAIGELNGRISKGEAMLSDIERAKQTLKRRDEIEVELAKVTQDIKVSDTLEKAYNPKGGVKATLLRDSLNLFEMSANDILAPMGLGELKLITQSGSKDVFEIHVGGAPDISFSRAQRHFINIVIQATLSLTTGIKILAIDDLDVFVGDMRRLANGAIFKMLEKFETVLLFKAQDEAPAPNAAQNISQFHLNGYLREVK